MKLFWDFLRNVFFKQFNFCVSKKSEFLLKKEMDQRMRSIKTDTVTEHFTSISCALEPAISHVTLVSGYLFDSCQLTITWMSIIKLNTDWICLEHLSASKCDILHLLTLSLPKFLVCADTVTKFYYLWCSNATGALLRNFYMTHVSAFDILNPSAGDVGAKKSNGKIWTQSGADYSWPNVIFVCVQPPLPLKENREGAEGVLRLA